MSPALQWFSTLPFNEELLEIADVKQYLHKTQSMMQTILNSGNFYAEAPALVAELMLFGTAAMHHTDDFEDVARFYTHTAGSYVIALDDRNKVSTFAREFEITVEQVMGWFKRENVSQAVRSAWDRGNYEQKVPILHFVDANPDVDKDSKLAVRMPFRSVYLEPGGIESDKHLLLEESGHEEFPVHVPRWGTTDGDTYGTTCPGMASLGDVRMLQTQERRLQQGVDLNNRPLLQGPPSLKGRPAGSYGDGYVIVGSEQVKAVHTVDPRVQEMVANIERTERRIEKAFFVDMFMAISTMEGIQPKNQLELSQRNQERLIVLGPVLQNLHRDFLGSMLERLFGQMVRAGILPEAPPELEGQFLKFEFTSTMAMAQRSAVTGNIERLTGFVSSLIAGGFPQAAEKFDSHQAVDDYSNAIGIPPGLVITDDIIAEQQKALQQQQRVEQGMNMAQQGAEIAEKAGKIDLEGDNVASRVASNLTGGQ
jgi:hypothetical protein